MAFLIGKTIISATTVEKYLHLGFGEGWYMDIKPLSTTGWLIYSDPEAIVGKTLKSLVMSFRLRPQESLPECFLDLPHLDRMMAGSPLERFSWNEVHYTPYQWQPHYLRFGDETEFLIVECMPSITDDHVSVCLYQRYEERSYLVNPVFAPKLG